MKALKKNSSMKYPKINYIGNKEKISTWIVSHLPIESGTVLDMFSGGNSLSYELKKNNYKVISNDVLYSSYVVGKALIENSNHTLAEEHIDNSQNLKLTDKDREPYLWLANNLYYPDEVDQLIKLIKYSLMLSSYEKYIFQSLIRRAMVRKLPYSRMNVPWSNIIKLRDENYSYQKYGRKRAYHNESFISHMKKNLQDYNFAIFDNGMNNIVYQEDAIDVLNKIDHVDMIYMDPPYPSTMNKYDDFYGAFDQIFDRKKAHIDLTDKKIFLDNLELILKKSFKKTNYVLLSLNSSSKPGIHEIIKLFEEYGKVIVKEKKHNYQVSGKSNKNKNYEQLIILELKKTRN